MGLLGLGEAMETTTTFTYSSSYEEEVGSKDLQVEEDASKKLSTTSSNLSKSSLEKALS